ncbi:MAG: tyrosine-type recombinase/integrase [Bdellovibrionales bacterium]
MSVAKVLKANFGTHSGWSQWYVVPEKNKKGEAIPKIKRYRKVNGKIKWQRYPARHYRGKKADEIDKLVNQLNATFLTDKKNAEERYKFDHAYINQHSIGKFEKHLRKKTTDEGNVRTVLQMLNEYVFEFFVLQHKIPDPSRWHQKEDEWGEFLLDRDLSAATIKKVVGTANRFNKFLIEKVYPEMSTPRKLEPVGTSVLDQLELERAKTEKVKTKYITPETFEKMIKAAMNKKTGDPEIIPNMKLCYAFGFRISETLGLTKDKFLKDNIVVDEQGFKVEEDLDGTTSIARKKVKTHARRVPYWNMTAQEAWNLVKEIKVMHPSTLVRRVNKIMGKFGHTSHDFRRTFITNSFRKAHWKDVMKAAGHTDVRTTMLYDMDDRNLSEEKADLD